MSWIKNYHPHWISNLDEAQQLLRGYAAQWVGQSIEATWVGLVPGRGTWWPDLPIVLVIGGQQYELCWYKLDEFAITEGQINVRNCWACGRRVPMRKDHLPELQNAVGKRILAIELGESQMDFGGPPIRIIASVNFILEDGYLSIFNGLDENALRDTPETAPIQRNYPIQPA